MIPLFLFGLGLLPVADPPASAPDIILRTYDLRLAAPVVDHGEVWECLLPNMGGHTRLDFESEWESQFLGEDVMSLIFELYDEEFEYADRRIEYLDDGRLLVGGPASVHRGVQGILGFLERAVASNARLRVDVLRLDGDAPIAWPSGSLIPEGEAQSLVAAAAAHGIHRSYELDLNPARVSKLDAVREVPILFDYDIEIAQGSYIYDPIVVPLTVGTQLAVRCAPAPGGTWLALTRRCAEQVGEVRRTEFSVGGRISHEGGTPMEMRGPKGIESVDMLSRSLATCAFLPDGRALVYRSGLDVVTGGGEELLVLRVEGEMPEPIQTCELDGGDRRLQLVDAGWIQPPYLRFQEGILSGEHLPRNAWYWLERILYGDDADVATSVVLHTAETDRVSDLLNDYHGEENALMTLGPWVVAVPMVEEGEDPQPIQADSPAFQLIEAPEVVEVSVSLVRTGEERPRVAGWDLPLVIGYPSVAVLGGESLYLGEYDVEVAQYCSANDPLSLYSFDGLALWLQPIRSASGEVVLEVRARARLRDGDFEDVDLGYGVTKWIQKVEYTELSANRQLRFRTGGRATRTAVLGDTTGTEEGGLALEITLR